MIGRLLSMPAPISRAASAISGPRRPVMKSRTPSAASSCADARPIPVDAPVMRATFPLSEFLIQADRELHRARQLTSPSSQASPVPYEPRRTTKELVRYVYFAVSWIGARGNEELPTIPSVSPLCCPMFHQRQDFVSLAIHQHLRVQRLREGSEIAVGDSSSATLGRRGKQISRDREAGHVIAAFRKGLHHHWHRREHRPRSRADIRSRRRHGRRM